jgi:hypothetical protein
MRNAMTAGLALWLVAFLSAQTSPAAEPETKLQDIREVVSLRNIRAIEGAIHELKRYVGDIDDYYVQVWREGDHVVVLFLNSKDAAPGRTHEGCAGPRPCIGVTLTADDYRVVRSSGQK